MKLPGRNDEITQPIRGPLAAQDYYAILLWHLTCRPLTAFWLPDFDAMVATSTHDNKLVLHDVIAAKPFNLSTVIPSLTPHPVTKLEFCFDTEDWWPAASHSEFEDADSPLFMRGGTASITGPVRFPELAHT